MGKKSFDTAAATNKFFTNQQPGTPEQREEQPAPNPDATMTPEQAAAILRQSMEILQNTTPQRGRPKKAEEEKLRGYRYNLNLDRDLKQYLKETAWKKRTSITQYINDLIRADMEAYFRECEEQGIDPREGWEIDEP